MERTVDNLLGEQACWLLDLDTLPTARALKSAYRAAMRRWHPDRFADDPVAQAAAGERAKLIVAAYERLSGRVAPRRA